jgi:prepilin-type N-terminal cleavage/methylation domain-containing protein
MKIRSTFNEKGVSLIELLVSLVIAAITLAGIYRVFISQTKTYAIQDQVVEVQQSVRSAMDIISRDLRMTGFDDDNPTSPYTVATAIKTPLASNSIEVNYEYYNKTLNQYELHKVNYALVAQPNGSLNLVRTKTVTAAILPIPNPATEVILENVNALAFTYGIDANSDGVMDIAGGVITAADYLAYNDPKISASTKVVAIRVTLAGGPNPTNQDISKVVSARALVSAVTLRNLCLR